MHVHVKVSLPMKWQSPNKTTDKLWFKYRAGIITASNMKAVSRTDSMNSLKSQNLLPCVQ